MYATDLMILGPVKAISLILYLSFGARSGQRISWHRRYFGSQNIVMATRTARPGALLISAFTFKPSVCNPFSYIIWSLYSQFVYFPCVHTRRAFALTNTFHLGHAIT